MQTADFQPESVFLVSADEILREIGPWPPLRRSTLARDRTLGIELALKVFHPPPALADEPPAFFAKRAFGGRPAPPWRGCHL